MCRKLRAPAIVAQAPAVRITDGDLVHTSMGGQEWYWRPEVFEAFITDSALVMVERREALRPIPRRRA